jgi:penicillin-binding protein 1A
MSIQRQFSATSNTKYNLCYISFSKATSIFIGKQLVKWVRFYFKWGFLLGFLSLILSAAALGVAYWLISPRLPNVAEIRDMRLQVPLRVLSADGKLIAVIGETRRTPKKITEIPDQLKNAFIAIEDARFYDHPGIDLVGIGRAVWLLATTNRERVPGGSTITQQVTRNYFLSPEYSATRKLSEIFLALKLERELSKDEILELYLNKIFFGYRAYGVAAAADFYYGKTLEQLTLAECATLASIPKFPSTGNPLSNPDRARQRRDYVLTRMLEVGLISQSDYNDAIRIEENAHPHEPPVEVEAPYVAEMVRVFAIEKLGNDALNNGYTVITTLDSKLQDGANRAIRDGLSVYDHRHGWRGPESKITLSDQTDTAVWNEQLAGFRTIGGLTPGLVTEVDAEQAQVYTGDGQSVSLPFASMQWASRYLTENSRGPAPRYASDVLKRGDIIRIVRGKEGEWELTQLPKAQSALVSISPENGAIKALVGGFSFSLSKFNRATQSARQPGSSFKPFVYSSAFERGFTPASIVNDAPVVFNDPSRPGGLWKPSNDDGEFEGPMRLREAMVKSRNLVSVRLLDAIGVRYAHEYLTQFGFPAESLPANLSLALGTSSLPPIAMARGYAVFSNGGYLIDPFLVDRIDNDLGEAVYQAQPKYVCAQCPERLAAQATEVNSSQDLGMLLGTTARTPPAEQPSVTSTHMHLAPRVIDAHNAFLITTMLRDVVLRGTGRGAMELGRHDLAGKTGTTNEHRDVWFSGFNSHLATTTWVGFDDFSPLGRGEFAAKTALPIWTQFMGIALEGIPEVPLTPPEGVTTIRINKATGLPSSDIDDSSVSEFFKTEDLTRLRATAQQNTSQQATDKQTFDIF